MKISISSLSKWAVRLAGSLSALFLLTGKSWGDMSLVTIEVLAIIMWAETEYRFLKKK
nr:MAG TPA: hypothetical protein [Caudoviricetes sp.]